MKIAPVLALGLAVLGGPSTTASASETPGIGQQGLMNQGEQFNAPRAQDDTGSMVGGGRTEVLYQGSRETVIRHFDERFAERALGTPVDAGGRTGEVVYLVPGSLARNLMLIASWVAESQGSPPTRLMLITSAGLVLAGTPSTLPPEAHTIASAMSEV